MKYVGEQGPELIFWIPRESNEPLTEWEELVVKHRNMIEATIADKYVRMAQLRWALFVIVRSAI